MLADIVAHLTGTYFVPALPKKRKFSVPRYSVSRAKTSPEEKAIRERIRKRDYMRRMRSADKG